MGYLTFSKLWYIYYEATKDLTVVAGCCAAWQWGWKCTKYRAAPACSCSNVSRTLDMYVLSTYYTAAQPNQLHYLINITESTLVMSDWQQYTWARDIATGGVLDDRGVLGVYTQSCSKFSVWYFSLCLELRASGARQAPASVLGYCSHCHNSPPPTTNSQHGDQARTTLTHSPVNNIHSDALSTVMSATDTQYRESQN